MRDELSLALFRGTKPEYRAKRELLAGRQAQKLNLSVCLGW